MNFEWLTLCQWYTKKRGVNLKQNLGAHHKHLHEADLTLYCLILSQLLSVRQVWLKSFKRLVWKTVNTTIFLTRFYDQQCQKFFSVPTIFLLSTSCSRIYSETFKTAVVVEKSFLKPDCLSFKFLVSLSNKICNLTMHKFFKDLY